MDPTDSSGSIGRLRISGNPDAGEVYTMLAYTLSPRRIGSVAPVWWYQQVPYAKIHSTPVREHRSDTGISLDKDVTGGGTGRSVVP